MKEVRTLRDLAFAIVQKEADIARLEERLSSEKSELNTLVHKRGPDLFDEAENQITAEFETNEGSIQMELLPYCHASIKKDSPNAEEAFDWLEKNDAGDLVKIRVTVAFGRGDAKKARALASELSGLGYTPEVDCSVPWQSLTAWLKRHMVRVREEGIKAPPLELLGATVGRYVKTKVIKKETI